MTREEIQAFLPNLPMLFGGLKYAVPSKAWLLGQFYTDFHAALWNESVNTWSAKWECRDFARAFACLAQMSNAAAKDTPEGDDAIAVGEFWFHPDDAPAGQNHAINACVTDGGLVFIEPQTGQARSVSQTELQSCTFLRW